MVVLSVVCAVTRFDDKATKGTYIISAYYQENLVFKSHERVHFDET